MEITSCGLELILPCLEAERQSMCDEYFVSCALVEVYASLWLASAMAIAHLMTFSVQHILLWTCECCLLQSKARIMPTALRMANRLV